MQTDKRRRSEVDVISGMFSRVIREGANFQLCFDSAGAEGCFRGASHPIMSSAGLVEAWQCFRSNT